METEETVEIVVIGTENVNDPGDDQDHLRTAARAETSSRIPILRVEDTGRGNAKTVTQTVAGAAAAEAAAIENGTETEVEDAKVAATMLPRAENATEISSTIAEVVAGEIEKTMARCNNREEAQALQRSQRSLHQT